jgi:glycosyltransferase involved in cell wall biosynthesis
VSQSVNRLRVLLLANDCNPDWPSLPVVGYNLCRALAEHVDAVVATHVRNRPALGRSGLGKARVEYLDNEYVAAPMYRLAKLLRGGNKVAWTTNVAMAYPSILAFEYEAWKAFRAPLTQGAFDVVHRVTPMSPTLPSYFAGHSPVPFVLGPLNGGLPWPKDFRGELRREREWLTYLRGFSRHLPFKRSTYHSAAAILAAFPHTIRDLPAGVEDKVVSFPEVGIDPLLFAAAPERPSRSSATFLFVGRLVPYKCADVVVRAFAAEPALRRHRLRIVGDGPDRALLEGLIAEHRLEECVALVGWRSQKEVGDEMRAADVFAFPSIRELGAGVVVEAMACGLPSIVVDYGGPGGLIRPETGVKVPLGNKRELVSQFARAMLELASSEERRRSLGRAAEQAALRDYSWDAKARGILAIYHRVLSGRAR